ncbi:16S rRNA (adenine(1518)-N(6)/adenine(1519)-N(6))-dimethyltransferase RsmA [Atopobium minutum]|uniref:Ribosomal RNA small subunit methyltransferase A n=1 Tax=Atopobium minutum 10063974 TaxID=997872 RepID=N2BIG8_9ACTN|nr:16S rRNA (adenine(1518)-N(6)/adenine(1519)-N(6))-dimethyltransferase RsmA [Atopobium minutum]EMZ41552.1 dimethyladenosine transferase [Atopobium minutum 10063974]
MYSPYATPRATRAVLEAFGLATKKRLGQNFLVNDQVIGHICDLAELDGSSSIVLEVGPGIGTLTAALLPRCKALCAIEADPELSQVYASTLALYTKRFALVQADALKVTPAMIAQALSSLEGVVQNTLPTIFVANLPYQIAATVLLKFFQQIPQLSRAVVMVQAEVADRITAVPGTKAYGAYTAKLSLYGTTTGRFEVGPGNFFPPPHVNSAVVRIDRAMAAHPKTQVPLTQHELQQVAQVIDAAFAQRRKTLRNSLASSGFAKEAIDKACEACGTNAGSRAETLSTTDFISLAFALAHSKPRA